MGRSLRNKQRVDYAKVNRKYDKFSFVSDKLVTLKIKSVTAAPGRARSAPPITAWPHAGMHQDVEYFADINTSLQWAIALPNDVRLPFAHLSLAGKHKWQGLKQQVALNGSVAARAHFDAVTTALEIGRSNPAITECVGEAAAAMAMLDEGGWEMIWGFHLHSGTGIDQIWRTPIGHGRYHYQIVEAKGPGAGLTQGFNLPPNYAQMESGWVINHLHSMNQNNHPAGVEICAALGLAFTIAHPNYGGAVKSYYGLAGNSRHAASGCRLTGRVITADWQADGRLHYIRGGLITYV